VILVSSTPFYIVDVFAQRKYVGNQLAVVRNAAAIADEDMQLIAREMHFSETTFILSEQQRDGGFDVRIFTPEEELPFAGHPTLGTAYVIQQEILRERAEEVRLNLKVGQIPVGFTYRDGQPEVLWMRQQTPEFGRDLDRKSIAEVLNLTAEQIDDRFPVQEVSTGVFFIIVPLKSLDAVRKARVDREKYFGLIKSIRAKAILVFAPETYDPQNHLNVRVFADYYGVAEDPATGSANGCLAGYLVRHGCFQTEQIDVRAEQGHEIKRPSLLLLKAQSRDGQIDVSVGGSVVTVARGDLV
jgi:trans-2,3-dihydro-3-hydroxyanthranilate isomerase